MTIPASEIAHSIDHRTSCEKVAGATYLGWMLCAMLTLLGSVSIVNWVVNPYSLFNPPNIPRINSTKPGYVEHLRLTHAYRITTYKPDCIILGTSRAGRGLRPDHPALSDLRCYNLSLPAISMYEMRRYLQHAQATRNLKLAILSLDFRVLNTPPDRSGAFAEARLAVAADGTPQQNPFSAWAPDMTSALVSLSALEASIDSVRRQSWVKDTLRPDGLWAQLDDRLDHRAAFDAYTRNTLARYAETRTDSKTFIANLEHYRLMLRDAHDHELDLRLIVPPSHAWHWEALWQSGLWPRFEEMKRALTRINEEEALHARRPPFPIFDFSGSEGPALEPLPAGTSQPMRWFWEPVHYKTALGDQVIARTLHQDTEILGAPSFGAPLTSATIETHLRHLQRRQQEFASLHPDVVAHISLLAADKIKLSR